MSFAAYIKRGVLYFILIVLLFLQSCQKITLGSSKPDKLIDKSTMEAVLVDVYLISAAKKMIRKKLEKEKIQPSLHVLSKYNITQEDFALSQRWYLEHTDVYLEMLKNISKKLDNNHKFTEDIIKKQKDFLEQQKKDASKNKDSCKSD